MMQDVFEKLQALQEVLECKYNVERELEEIPKAINTKKELVARLKKQFIEKSELLEKKQLKVKDLKSRLKDAEERRGKYERDMDIIKTQKEYEVLDKAIKDTILEEQNLRKELLKEEKETEEQNLTVEREQNLINSQEEELRAEEEKIAAESDTKRAELEELNRKKDEISEGLDDEILFKFERIIKSKEGGHGIVPVKGLVCSACHMILPAQFVNDVRQGDSIMFCPYCSRILFYVESENEEEMTFNYNENIGFFDDEEENPYDEEENPYDDEDSYSEDGDDEETSLDSENEEEFYDDETAEEQEEMLGEDEDFSDEYDEDFSDEDEDGYDDDEDESLDEMGEEEEDDEDDEDDEE